MTTQGVQAPARFDHKQLTEFLTQVLIHLDVPPEDAAVTTASLIEADLLGIDSHGIAQLATRSMLYVQAMQNGKTLVKAKPVIVRESASLAVVDGGAGIGQVAANFAQELAMKKARETGMGGVAVRNSHHFGAAGVWALKAAEAGMIGMVVQNGGKLVAAAGGSERLFGTNPIAFAAPSEPHPFYVDFATSAVSLGKLQLAEIAGKTIPEGWAIDVEGHPSTDPKVFWQGGALLPLGSTPTYSWHKGYALAFLVEILSGVLSAGITGVLDEFNKNYEHCHFHLAIDVGQARPLGDFVGQMVEVETAVRQSRPADPERPVLIPGDMEFRNKAERLEKGIPLHPTIVDGLVKLAEEYGLQAPTPLG
ncbi:MAG TPA: Ldh family oxidoreductase [Dehalococcoidia bacterium]|nr:Ldh family oxidoreductase [Dehalococcoidia bacterium]